MMTIEEVSQHDYRCIFTRPTLAFDSVDFNVLNQSKTAALRFLTFVDEGKPRLGLIAGDAGEGKLKAPFSAPFAALEAVGRQRLDTYIEAAQALARDFDGRITLPPPCYASEFDRDAIAKQAPAMLSAAGTSLSYADYNYHFDLADYARIGELMDTKARGKLRAAVRNGFEFVSKVPLGEAYDVVVENHADRGYPIRMTLEGLQETSEIINVECFGATLDGELAAAAIMYHTSHDAVQVIYWADRPSMRQLRPMNFLADRLLNHYHARGKRVFDIGPASEEGIPALGLCDFKAGLGCRLTVKPTIIF